MSCLDKESMLELLKLQRDSFTAEGFPSVDIRISRLDRLLTALKKYDKKICDTISEDFGGRSYELSRLSEVYISIEHTKDAIANVAEWMKPEQRNAPFPACDAGATAELRYQPKGVVGIIGPWNFPVHLIIGPLVCVLAAGNRALIKPSELAPKTADLLEEMFSEYFDKSEIAVIQGGADVAANFSSLPFDHMMFTGSTNVGRKVMRAAAENLAPVTLELGGKSPVVIDRDVDLPLVAIRLMAGKLFNTGQICVCPDYAFVHEDMVQALLKELAAATKKLFPTVKDNADYTAIINENHYDRLQSLVDDAVKRDIEMLEINPANEQYSQAETRKMLPKIFINPSDDALIMQSEIFGPLLPIKTYKTLDEVVAHIQAHDRPLALYYFGNNEDNQKVFVDDVIAGGMTINDVVLHVICNDLPLGGVGASGMGRYHGRDGFKEFSHMKSVYVQTPVEEIAGFMRPPYSNEMRSMLEQQITEE